MGMLRLTEDEKENSFRQAMYRAIKKEIADGIEREQQAKDWRGKQQKRSERQERSSESKARLRDAKEHLNRGLTAMDSCHTIFFELFTYSEHFARSLQFELEEKLVEVLREKIKNNLGPDLQKLLLDSPKQIINPPTLSGLAKSIIESMINASVHEDPEVFLPGILHFVELKADSTIDASPLRFSSGLKDNVVAQDQFNEALKKWLDAQNYEKNRSGQVVDKATKAVLTPDAFAMLRDDPTHGLTAHLKKEWQVEDIVQERAPAPSPGA